MLKRIKDYLSKRKQVQYEREYTYGYSWAAGKILSGQMTAKLIKHHECISSLSNTPFDDGYRDALGDGIIKGLVEIDASDYVPAGAQNHC